MNSRQYSESDESKIIREKMINPLRTEKMTEVFFLPLRFYIMNQSKLKVRADEQFRLIDKDAQHIGGQFLNHRTVVK